MGTSFGDQLNWARKKCLQSIAWTFILGTRWIRTMKHTVIPSKKHALAPKYKKLFPQFAPPETWRIRVCTSLAAMLKDHIGTRTSGLLFCTSTGAQLLQSNTLQDSLHPILKELEHVKGGFNIFRRFRITKLKTSDCPEFLQHFWSGHAQTHVSERYTKLLQDRDYRLEWAEKIGMGFDLPARSPGLRGLLIPFRKVG
jgi:hypothetical protein